MLLGDCPSDSDLHSKATCAGSVTLLITDTNVPVVFDEAMPSATYQVFLQVEANLATVLWPTAKTTAGFTLNTSVGIAGDVAWLAIEG